MRMQTKEAKSDRLPSPNSDLDLVLTAQIAVAWAGEGGLADGVARLGWWKTDLVSEFGGEDLFRRLMPTTWEWATLQAVREAACRHDAALREKDHNSDRLISLFYLGFEVDERAEERLMDLKRSGKKPLEALPDLASFIGRPWDREVFVTWLESNGTAEHTPSPVGRRLKGVPSTAVNQTVRLLLAALVPVAEHYPLPHFRKSS